MKSALLQIYSMIVATLLVACSHTTAGETARARESTSAAPVNTSVLDPGKYPVAPQPPLGNAGNDRAGRLVEGRRMAAYVVGPWQIEPTLIGLSSSGPAVIADSKGLSRAVWPPIGGGAYNLSLVVGFVTERQSPGANPQMALRNSVLRFANPAEASQAAQNMTTAARNMPRDPTATPIVTEPERPLPIPGHPEASGTVLTFQEGAQTVRELTALTAHGPYVFVQVVRCAAGPDCEAQLAGHTLDRQVPLIDTFVPTQAVEFPTLALDPTGLVARTLPPPADQTTSMSGAAYPPAGALHLVDDPVQTGPLLSAAGVDYVSVNLTTVYQAKDPSAAQTLAQSYSDLAAKTPAAQAAAPVPGLPDSHCTRVAGSNGLVPRYWCLAAAGRYTIKTVARQLDNVQQQMAAQYRILTAS
ncbi:hypothetical protein AWC05_16880 [Mycobacterium florentinum]|uniref:PknH-like extracellular domain-containing protein n=1 Tax=Mycobacterium florentinum TaxID=292462 RepID=A0A1X1UBW4_MYCFL|nr:hypothetical protein [Mycobacterium florentinum]MCV7412288.1 hypothetical protein [Mycobacterium florentinum]ORV54290.1 hypothetical protein AWC05_16880 [Mycobacterium florentinum]BBX81668.1 hypothetical protein MFLOJ_54550 [Mycobacterium florentinum]